MESPRRVCFQLSLGSASVSPTGMPVLGRQAREADSRAWGSVGLLGPSYVGADFAPRCAAVRLCVWIRRSRIDIQAAPCCLKTESRILFKLTGDGFLDCIIIESLHNPIADA